MCFVHNNAHNATHKYTKFTFTPKEKDIEKAGRIYMEYSLKRSFQLQGKQRAHYCDQLRCYKELRQHWNEIAVCVCVCECLMEFQLSGTSCCWLKTSFFVVFACAFVFVVEHTTSRKPSSSSYCTILECKYIQTKSSSEYTNELTNEPI